MKKFIIILIALAAFSSCYEDFLQKEPLGITDYETVFKSEEQALLALYGVYDALQGHESYDRNFFTYGDIMSDDTEEGGNIGGDESGIRTFQRYTMTSNDGYLTNFYRSMYIGIQRANSLIFYTDPTTDELKRIVAEAKVLRSLFYFDLVRVFGPVIYIDGPVNFEEASSLSNRQVEGDNDEGSLQVAMIYDKIVETLESAIPDLLEENIGYLSKESGQGLLAKVFMYRKNDGDYRNALNLVDSLYAKKGDPYVKYPDIFSEYNENNHESLIEIQFERSAGYNKDNDGEGSIRSIDQSYRFVYRLDNGVLVPNPNMVNYGLNTPTKNLFDAFEKDGDSREYDPRLEMILKDENALYPGSPRDTVFISPNYQGFKNGFVPVNLTLVATGFVHRKAEPRRGFADDGENNQARGINHILLRYADVLLLGSEAALHLGENDKALKYFNLVRKRARESKVVGKSLTTEEWFYDSIPSPIPRDLTVSELNIDSVRDERRRELFCEHQRFFDLVRWDIQDDVLGALTVDGLGVNIDWKPHNKVLPIPLNQIMQHGGNLKQNPNYN